jgi:hypothetical protein
MAEFAFAPVQVVEPNQNILLDTVIPCNNGYVFHRDQSGIVILRGITNNCFARYQVTINGNIALPEDAAAVVPISVALAIDGEPVQTSRAIYTPAAVDEYGNVTSTAIVTVPRGCCFTIAVENTSAVVDGVAPAINVQNANMTVSRIA